MWHKQLWLIDHGACLYFHHSWSTWQTHAKSPFPLIKDHVLLPQASSLEETNKEFMQLLTEEKLRSIVALIPDEWLYWEGTKETPQSIRDIYLQFLQIRLSYSETFTKEAQNAREILV